jgi:hypothetical protein
MLCWDVAVGSKAYAGQSWLDHVQGCACCLTRTAGVSPCYLAAKGCGDNGTLANCCWNNALTQQKNKVPCPQCDYACTILVADN